MNSGTRGNATDRIVDLTLRATRERLPRIVDLSRDYDVHPRTISRIIRAIERRAPVRWQEEA
jgi:hypothetical protein